MALIINPNAKSGSDFNQMFPHLSAKDFDDYIYYHNSNPDYGRSAYFWSDGKDVFMETFLGDTDQIQECCHEYMRSHNDTIVTLLLEMEQQKNVHDEYIHSDEFIRQFGDWEKINRIEKLKKSKPLSIDGSIIINGEDVTDKINELRENPSKKNIKLLNNYVVALGKEMIHDIRLENNLSPYENPKFHINDDGKTYNFSFAGIKEVSRHNLYQPGHIEGIYNIPEIIRSSIYIGTENNDDHRKPELKKFYYYALGIKLNNVDYTAKIVFTEKNNGDIYYDQSLSDIEKGKFIDLIKKEPDAVNRINRPDSIGRSAEAVHPHKKGQNSHNPYYDKRLFRICQVPQLPYLERNPLTNFWRPTEEAIELVRTNQLYVQKDGQIYNMIDNRQIKDTETVKSQFDKELSDYTDGKLPEGHVFNLGIPGEILQKCGFPKDQRIELSGSRLKFKSNLKSHPFEVNDIFGLDEALQTPIAVFSYGDRNKSQNVIVNLEKDGKNFLAGVHFNQKKNGLEVSSIRTIFPKDNVDWLNWINQGKMIYGNKEKLQALIAQQRINVADVSSQVVQSPLHERCLESANSILEKFGDVKDIFTDGHAFYDEIRKQSAIEQKFFGYYTEKSNLDARELAQFEAQEFYHALKSGDVEKIREYTEHEELHEISDVAKKIYESQFSPQIQKNSNSVGNPLTEPFTIDVNGKERECRNGVLEGFKNAVRRLDGIIDTNHELCDENNRLVMENMRLKEQLNKKNHNKEHERG
ncbi:MAG: hypothetical protein K5751_07845 [Treponemataceae bacterium]|nr:hypothetical protein [Treponemataceae bacterium]